MSFPNIDIERLKLQAKEYDYIRFTFSDIHGIPRGKTVSGRFADKFLEEGVACYTGSIVNGPLSEVPTMPIFAAGGDRNMFVKPAIPWIYRLPWCCNQKKRVGEIVCEPVWDYGKVQEANPRYVARKQLEKLEEMGLKLYSSFEMELMFFEKESLKPIFEGNDYITVLTYSENAAMMEEFDLQMKELGIDIETFHCEGTPGQIEFTFEPKFGIKTADMIFQFKEAIKELCNQKGYHATSMTRPFGGSSYSNGSHFNFSVWDDSGNNVFYDRNRDNNLSQTALYFVGGLMKHLKALTAILCPTANCYRRLHEQWVPDYVNWGINDRHKSIRVKNLSVNSTYIENRLPSGSVNPYLALAGTLAAGLDGIKNKTEPPKPGERNERLPDTLEEALDILKTDSCMKEALGEEFVDWFIACKKQVDVAKFGKHRMKSGSPTEIAAERKEYFKFI